METVAFFGLGQMGQGMALRLLESGYPLHVYNRTPNRAVPLAALLEDRFLRSLANGRADLDWLAISIDQRESVGLANN